MVYFDTNLNLCKTTQVTFVISQKNKEKEVFFMKITYKHDGAGKDRDFISVSKTGNSVAIFHGVDEVFSPSNPRKNITGRELAEFAADCFKGQTGYLKDSLLKINGKINDLLTTSINVPGVCVAAVKVTEKMTHFATIGDSFVIINTSNGYIMTPNPHWKHEEKMDALILGYKLVLQRDYKMTQEEADKAVWDFIYPHLVNERYLDANSIDRDSGYGILNGSLKSKSMITGTVRTSDIKEILLLSGGTFPFTINDRNIKETKHQVISLYHASNNVESGLENIYDYYGRLQNKKGSNDDYVLTHECMMVTIKL
jgi:hypothetical protein